MWMPFSVMVLVVAVLIWRGLVWHYGERIEALEHRIKLRDDRIAHLERDKASGKAKRAAPPAGEAVAAKGSPAKTLPLASEPAPEHGPRVFVPEEVTTDFLRSLYDKHTSLQADKLADAYIGKWIKVRGFVSDVHRSGENLSVALRKGTHPVSPDFLITTWLSFSRDLDRAEMLRTGDTVLAIGRIVRFGRYDCHLRDCEMIEAE